MIKPKKIHKAFIIADSKEHKEELKELRESVRKLMEFLNNAEFFYRPEGAAIPEIRQIKPIVLAPYPDKKPKEKKAPSRGFKFWDESTK